MTVLTSSTLATVAQYWYDAEGQRIRKVSAAGTEEYVYDPQGHQVGEMQPTGAFNRIELYAGSRHLATYDQVPFQTVFIHNYWQGTERVRSLYTGASYETCSNLPYGDFVGQSQMCTLVDKTDPVSGKTTKVRGAEAREVIRNRYPGTITLELPGLSEYPAGTTKPVFPGTIFMPRGEPCPQP